MPAMVKKLVLTKYGSLIGKFRPTLAHGMDKKDLATPRSATGETGRRRIERRAKKLSGYNGTVQVPLTMNVISSLLLGLRTPANAFERCLYKDALARSRAHNAHHTASQGVLFACGACAARQPRDCICSGIAFLHDNVDSQQLTEFVSGLGFWSSDIHPRNSPIKRSTAQADRQATRTSWQTKPISTEIHKNATVFARAAYTLPDGRKVQGHDNLELS